MAAGRGIEGDCGRDGKGRDGKVAEKADERAGALRDCGGMAKIGCGRKLFDQALKVAEGIEKAG
jgi:hypothetical protein